MQTWHDSIPAFVLVFVGGGLGSILRYAVNQSSAASSHNIPWGTLFVNVVGSLAMGLLAGWFTSRTGASQPLRLFLATGVLGGFTTFSAFSLDAALLWQRGQSAAALSYIIGSVVAAIIGVFTGLAIMRAWFV